MIERSTIPNFLLENSKDYWLSAIFFLTVHLHPSTARRNLLPYPQYSLDSILTPGLGPQTSQIGRAHV